MEVKQMVHYLLDVSVQVEVIEFLGCFYIGYVGVVQKSVGLSEVEQSEISRRGILVLASQKVENTIRKRPRFDLHDILRRIHDSTASTGLGKQVIAEGLISFNLDVVVVQ